MTTVHRDEKVHIGSGGSQNGGRVSDSFIITTTDATTTVIKRILLAQGESVTVRAFGGGKKADVSSAAGAALTATFRRAVSGNVTLVGAVQGTTQEDSAGAPAVAIAANTGTQSVDVTVAGVVAETWKWEVEVAFLKF